MAKPSSDKAERLVPIPEVEANDALRNSSVDGRSVRRLQNRELLLDGAADVFAELGFDAAKAEDILLRSGISRRTFYQHFSDKNEVLSALYARATKQLLERIVGAMTNPMSGIESVTTMLDIFLAYQLRSPPLIRELGVQALRLDGPLRKTRQELHDSIVQVLSKAWAKAEKSSLDPWMLRSWILMVESFCVHVLVETPADKIHLARAREVLHDNLLALFTPHLSVTNSRYIATTSR